MIRCITGSIDYTQCGIEKLIVTEVEPPPQIGNQKEEKNGKMRSGAGACLDRSTPAPAQ